MDTPNKNHIKPLHHGFTPAMQSPSTLLPPNHFFHKASTLTIAQVLNDTLREDAYKRGFKSGNKIHTLNRDNRFTFYKKRQKQADLVLGNLRKNSTWGSASRARQAIALHAQNCCELGHMGQWLLQHIAGQKSAPSYCVSFSSYDHVILLIGNFFGFFNSDPPHEWHYLPTSLVVCDPWLNVVATVGEYPKQYLSKAQKWDALHKQIQSPPPGSKLNKLKNYKPTDPTIQINFSKSLPLEFMPTLDLKL
jgi:hypothetical protein